MVHNENTEVAKYLIEKGARINALKDEGVRPLHLAAGYNENAELIKFLIE